MKGLREIFLIHDLKKQGLSITAIARKVGCDRKTVRKHLERGMEAPVYGPRPSRPRMVGVSGTLCIGSPVRAPC